MERENQEDRRKTVRSTKTQLEIAAVCVCAALWRTCAEGDWDLSMVDIPRLTSHEFRGCLATCPASLSLSLSLSIWIFVWHLFIILLPFHSLPFCFQGSRKWSLDVFAGVNTTEETSSAHVLASDGVHVAAVGRKPAAGKEDSQRGEVSSCGARTHEHVTDCND